MLVELPNWVRISLSQARLSEIARKTGITVKQLRNLRDGRCVRVRQKTLAALQEVLCPPDLTEEDLALSINADDVFELIVNCQKTARRILRALADSERGVAEILIPPGEYVGVSLYSKERPLLRFGARTGKPVITHTDFLNIVLGRRITLGQLLGIARVLKRDPSDLFVGRPEGLAWFWQQLRASTKNKYYNRVLNNVRKILDLKP